MKKFVLKLIQAASVRNRFTNDLEREFQIDQNFAWQSANAYLILTEGVCTCRTKFLLHRATNETKKVGGGGKPSFDAKKLPRQKSYVLRVKGKVCKEVGWDQAPTPRPPVIRGFATGGHGFFYNRQKFTK